MEQPRQIRGLAPQSTGLGFFLSSSASLVRAVLSTVCAAVAASTQLPFCLKSCSVMRKRSLDMNCLKMASKNDFSFTVDSAFGKAAFALHKADIDKGCNKSGN